ncbi:MAG TPA: hypothetical protein V6C86_01105 [Oculatellaceae cyanobacterium]
MLIIPPPRPNDDRSSRKPNNAKGALSLFIVIPFLVPLASWAGHSQTANPTIPQVAAATSAMHTEDGISPIAEPPARPADKSPVAEPPEKSSDKGFSTEDFLQPDKKDERNRNRDAQLVPRSTEPPAQTNVRVRINVPHYLDAVDMFVAYPYPMPCPIPRRPPGYKGKSDPGAAKPLVPQQAYDKMPNTRKAIRDLILQTGYTQRTKSSVAYPQGGWRWQIAYRNALKRCPLGEPTIFTEMYPFVNAMEPLVREECKKMDELEEDRQRRYTAAYEEWQLNRSDYEAAAVRKGYFPIEFNPQKGWRGPKSVAELKLGPGTWWITGTHKVPGLKYYWQYPVEIVNGQVENVDLTWQNALVIEGGW